MAAEHCRGVIQDLNKAFEWYTKAAIQGYVKAQFNLGVFYDNGQGVARDVVQAVKWYTKAATQGLKEAQFNLGLAFETGQGVPQNRDEGIYSRWTRHNLQE